MTIDLPAHLTERGEPGEVTLLRSDSSQTLLRTVQEWHTDDRVRIVRGHSMQTWPEVYSEFAAAFQFPIYFGRNIEAFIESLSEPEQEPVGGPRICIIIGAEELLASEETDALPLFAQVIRAARENWNLRPPPHLGRISPVFSTVLAPYDAADEVELLWRTAGATIREHRL
jgi:hypothetical protein